MHLRTEARAERRALISAVLIGSGIGLSLGAVYMAGGLADAAADHHRAARLAEASAQGFSDAGLRAGGGAGVIGLRGPLAGLDVSDAPAIPARPSRARELDCLAQAVYFEARGETPRGQAAVATVIINRVKNPNFPKTVCEVVYQGAGRTGCQFSFACDGAAEQVVEAGAWTRARRVAARALSGALLADIGSATHFHTTAVAPQWDTRMLRVAQVGLHVFYRFNPRAAPAVEGPQQAVLVSLPASPVQPADLRLASAVAESADDRQASAAKPAAAPAAAPEPKASEPAPAGLAKAADAQPAGKSEDPTAS